MGKSQKYFENIFCFSFAVPSNGSVSQAERPVVGGEEGVGGAQGGHQGAGAGAQESGDDAGLSCA